MNPNDMNVREKYKTIFSTRDTSIKLYKMELKKLKKSTVQLINPHTTKEGSIFKTPVCPVLLKKKMIYYITDDVDSTTLVKIKTYFGP